MLLSERVLAKRSIWKRLWTFDGTPIQSSPSIAGAVLAAIGSSNMDIRSFSINYESNAVIYDANVAQELEADFLKDIEECKEFTVEEYEKRPFSHRLSDSFCRLLSPLL